MYFFCLTFGFCFVFIKSSTDINEFKGFSQNKYIVHFWYLKNVTDNNNENSKQVDSNLKQISDTYFKTK